jgi:hypothetical protein
MSADRGMRASDRDREAAAEVLCEGYAAGRLSAAEFEERSVAASSAATWGELRDLTADLPPLPPEAGLPSDIVAPRAPSRPRSGRLIGTFLLVLLAGLAGRAVPAAVWAAAVAIPFLLLLPFACRGFSTRRSPAGRSRTPGPPAGPPRR